MGLMGDIFGGSSGSSSTTDAGYNPIVSTGTGITIGQRGRYTDSRRVDYTGATINQLPDNAVEIVKSALSSVTSFGGNAFNAVLANNTAIADKISDVSTGQNNLTKILPWVIIGTVAIAFLMYRK